MRYSLSFLALCIAFLIGGCDQRQTSDPEPPIESLRLTSVEDVDSEAPIRSKFEDRIPHQKSQSTLRWDQASRIQIQINNSYDTHDAIVIPSSTKGRSVRVKDTRRSVTQSRVVYLPSLDVAFREDHSVDATGTGHLSVTVLGTDERALFRVENGRPIERISATQKYSVREPRTQFYEGTWACYNAAHDACGVDGECQALCDFLDPFCSASILSACAIINNT